MITKFRLFEKDECDYSYYYRIPYRSRDLIKLVFEKEKVKLKLTDERITMLMDELSDNEYDSLINLYVFVGDDGFLGFWAITENETEKLTEELLIFIKKHEMINKGSLELEPYEVDANKYNL